MSEYVIQLFEFAGTLLEIAGVLAILAGALIATSLYVKSAKAGGGEQAFAAYRADLGKGILLGLEFLVAADIVETVAVDPSWENVGTLAVIVAIRTFLSFTLEMEITGRLPWQKESDA